MRTTLAIDDGVLEDARAVADARGITLGELVTDALRAMLAHVAAEPPSPPYRAVVHGTPGHLPTDPQAIAALIAEDDERSVPPR